MKTATSQHLLTKRSNCSILIGVFLVLVAVIAWPVHYFGNQWSYKQGWRDTPH